MLEGAAHRWEYIDFGSLGGMNHAGLDVSAGLRPTANGLALSVTISGKPEAMERPLGGDIALRLHTEEGVENASPLRPRVNLVCGDARSAAGSMEVLFPWRSRPFSAGILELSTQRQTCLLAIPYGFLNDPRQHLHAAPRQDARKAPATIPRSAGVLHVLPQRVRYITVPLPGGATLDLAQRNPFQGITELRLLQPAFDHAADDMMHAPRTSVVLYIDGQEVLRSNCVAILRSEQGRSLRRTDRHVLWTRQTLPVPAGANSPWKSTAAKCAAS